LERPATEPGLEYFGSSSHHRACSRVGKPTVLSE
jgi:hypothetical protein